VAKRTVVWTETAIKQRRNILEYWVIKNKSTLYSEKLIQLIRKQIKSIEKSPYSFRKADYPNIHLAVIGHFSLYYKIAITEIIIVALWDNRQDPVKLYKIIK